MALQCEQRASEGGSEYEWVSELSPQPARSLGAHFHILHAYLVRDHRSVSRNKQLAILMICIRKRTSEESPNLTAKCHGIFPKIVT